MVEAVLGPAVLNRRDDAQERWPPLPPRPPRGRSLPASAPRRRWPAARFGEGEGHRRRGRGVPAVGGRERCPGDAVEERERRGKGERERGERAGGTHCKGKGRPHAL